MSRRRTHSSIDKLPAELQKTLERMLIDNEWPVDFAGAIRGKPRYKDLLNYCTQKGHAVSLSAIGRFGVQMRTLARMKQAGLIARSAMEGLNAENASAQQKAAAEMITARVIELVASDKKMTEKQIREISTGLKDCTQIIVKADQYRQQQSAKRAQAADKTISDIATKKNIDPETLRLIREQVYGIVK